MSIEAGVIYGNGRKGELPYSGASVGRQAFMPELLLSERQMDDLMLSEHHLAQQKAQEVPAHCESEESRLRSKLSFLPSLVFTETRDIADLQHQQRLQMLDLNLAGVVRHPAGVSFSAKLDAAQSQPFHQTEKFGRYFSCTHLINLNTISLFINFSNSTSHVCLSSSP